MSQIAMIRANGGQLTYEGESIRLERVTSADKEWVRDNKPLVISILKSEETSGIRYVNSSLYVAMDKLYSEVKRITTEAGLMEEGKRLAEIIAELDAECFKSLSDALPKFKAYNTEAWALARPLLNHFGLAGRELYQLAHQLFKGPAQAEPKAIHQVDDSAFGPAAQEALAL